MTMMLHLVRGNNHEGANLVLPATPADVGQAYARLDAVTRYPGEVKIDSVTCSVRNLENYLTGMDLDRPTVMLRLNQLAEKVEQMTSLEK